VAAPAGVKPVPRAADRGGTLRAVRFTDRADAGRRLADQLTALRGRDVVVLGLPRGGVPVAAPVAAALGAPLDVIVVRKIGVPSQPELGMGAVGEEGVTIVNDEIVRAAGVAAPVLQDVAARERRVLDGQVARWRGDRPPVPLAGRTAVIVDDGIATGSTARAAAAVARARGAAAVVLAVPVAPPDVATALGADFDAVVALETPWSLGAVGQWYLDFSPTTDDEVARTLAGAGHPRPAG
jgi:predicted phosphoribosyltransferase